VDPETPPARPRRSTGDILLLGIAATVCFAVLVTGMAILVVRIVRPEQDVSTAVAFVSDTLNTLIGLMAGFLAGRTEQQRRQGAD
jgi:hypothetical protein